MCGIACYIGKKKAIPVIINSLKALEYRGYDSAGLAYIKDNKVKKIKKSGKLLNLENSVDFNEETFVGIGHTRWATHGKATSKNAHPHTSNKITLVHNGIIENYEELKIKLIKYGYEFISDTDSEVAAAYIDYCYKNEKNMLKALEKAKYDLKGSYAFGIICSDELDKIYALRKESPLIIGKNDDGFFIASDVPAILNYTNKYYLLDNYEIAMLDKNNISFYNNSKINKDLKTYDGNNSAVSKNGYEHFMLKEMFEEPIVLKNSFNEYNFLEDLSKYSSIDIIACGSAYHAGLVGKFLFEKYAQIKTTVHIASEYRYAPFFKEKNSLAIFISQSGETADTLAALKLAKDNKVDTLAIVNVKESSIAREADKVIYTKAGIEIAVATTKAYLAQITTLSLIALKTAFVKKKITKELYDNYLDSYNKTSNLIKKLLKIDYDEISEIISKKNDVFFIGRSIDYYLSLEGSLKLKEISYIHSEAYAAGELKHGTISLIEKNTPVVSVITDNELKDKTISNNKEVISRGAYVISITNSDIPSDSYNIKIDIPNLNDFVNPILAVVVMQKLGYEVAKKRGCDIDKPKNLAKSVTVE